MENVSMLVKYLNFISQTVIYNHDWKKTGRIYQTLGDAEFFYDFLWLFDFQKTFDVIEDHVEK